MTSDTKLVPAKQLVHVVLPCVSDDRPQRVTMLRATPDDRAPTGRMTMLRRTPA